MTRTRSQLTRWTVPVAVLATVLAVAGWRTSVASAAPALPRISAAQLLAKVANSHVQSLSGVVQTTTNLGLPALPDTGGALSPQALLSGRHTLRVYLDGPDRQRVDLLGTLAETNLVHNGGDIWQWSSTTNKATHSRLPALPTGRQALGRAHSPAGTPQALAQQLLDAVDPTTSVSVGTAAIVAGRSAYDLRLAPKTGDSLIQRADLYVDAATGLPLRATVLARGASKPAIDVGFTSIALRAPAAKVFRFTAPAGAKLTEGAPPSSADSEPKRSGGLMRFGRTPSAASGAKVLGSGWSAVAELRSGPVSTADRQLNLLLRGAPAVTGRFGSGRLITTRLLTVLITDDGRIFAGAVTRQALLRTADSAGHG